jgi:hypothetical protein
MMNERELGEFYRRIGAALCHLQYLEDVLVTFLAMKIIHERRGAGHTFTTSDAQTLLTEKRRILTLGPLIDSCISQKIVRHEHQGRFKAFKRERDWLVHRLIIVSGDDLYVAATRHAVFSRITAIQKEAILLKKIAVADLEGWGAAHGVDVGATQNKQKEEERNMNNKPLRDVTDSERILALDLSGFSRAHCLWVLDTADGGRVFIVCPALAVQGVAVGVDRDGRELWRKPAFYSELLGAGDGYELQYGSLRPTVRASFDGTWIASVQLPDGSFRSSATLIFDERVAKELARELAEQHFAESGYPPPPDDDLTWKRTQD